MTVCIVAIGRDYSDDQECLVTVSDQMISVDGLGSSDYGTQKAERLWEDWSAMFAGDAGQASTILQMARETLRADPDRQNTVSSVRFAFKEVYRQRLAEIAGDRVLSPFGLDMARFIQRGRHIFTEEVFSTLSEEIRRVSADCQFVVYGFDGQRRARVFKVAEGAGTGPEDVDCGRPGFAVIGAGTYPAEMILYHLDQNPDVRWTETIYNVCAAKFMTERVPGVGGNTNLYVKKPGSVGFDRAFSLIREIRESWEKDGAPKLPAGIVDKIENARLRFHFPEE